MQNIEEAYTDFAAVYDILMDSTPYQEWCDFVEECIEKYGVSQKVRRRETADGEMADVQALTGDDTGAEDSDDREGEEMWEELLTSERNLVVDLGCGTGTLAELLYARGYDMIGVDNSPSMLEVAMDKKEVSGSEILYLLQDMRELELYSTVGTVVSVCDSLNYILEEDELETVFSLVNNYLYPGGIFLFDFNTDYKYREVIGDTTIAENREDCSFIWENFYDQETQINEYDVTIFVKEGEELFRRFAETHLQRGYSVEQMTALVERAGMAVVQVLDADTRQEVTPQSERVYVIAREQGKKQYQI